MADIDVLIGDLIAGGDMASTVGTGTTFTIRMPLSAGKGPGDGAGGSGSANRYSPWSNAINWLIIHQSGSFRKRHRNVSISSFFSGRIWAGSKKP